MMFWLAHNLSGPTLVVVNMLLSGISALMMLCVYAAHRKSAGLAMWISSNAIFMLGFGLIMFDEYISRRFSELVGNGLIDLGVAFAFVAVWQLLERPKRELGMLAVTAVFLVAEAIAFLGYPTPSGDADYGLMTLLWCSSRASLTIATGWLLWRHAKPVFRPASTLSAILHFAWATMLIGRIVWWQMNTVLDLSWDPTTPFALLARIALTFAVTPSYLWMLNRQLDADLIRQAREDPLTGIANRRVMWDSGQGRLADCINHSHCLAVLMIDIDHFKAINDSWGHDAGDKALVAVARTLAANLRGNDFVARVGGEEFMVLMVDADAEKALEIGDRLRRAIESLVVTTATGDPLTCTISIGYSLFDRDGANWDDIVIAADAALYRAKRLGRNRIEAAGQFDDKVVALG